MDAEVLEAVRDARADGRSVLTDAAREDERIHAAHRGSERTDSLLCLVAEELDGFGCTRVGARCREEPPHVAGRLRYAEQS